MCIFNFDLFAFLSSLNFQTSQSDGKKYYVDKRLYWTPPVSKKIINNEEGGGENHSAQTPEIQGQNNNELLCAGFVNKLYHFCEIFEKLWEIPAKLQACC